MGKLRLDTLLIEKGLFSSREKAKAAIMAGLIFVDGQRVDKAGTTVSKAADINVQGNVCPYVSRGGLKLEKAISEFGLNFEGKTVMDIGASTGGFTDCALKKGAVRVYSVDVGYGQLAWVLRQDPRVINLERTNIRYLEKEKVVSEIDFITIDVSFISLGKVLPKAYDFLKRGGELVALIKPQFEAGRERVGKKGVVKDPDIHRNVIEKVLNEAMALGFRVKGISFSPIKGPEGNIEYLAYFEKAGVEEILHDIIIDVEGNVEKAHQQLS